MELGVVLREIVFAVTVAAAVPEHPLASVMVTVYAAAVTFEIEAVVALFDQR